MKNIGLLLCSVAGFFIILGCLFYNSLLIDMNRIKDYVTESNYILQDVLEEEEKVNDKKGEYISRLLDIKDGMENTTTSFLLEEYKLIKTSSIELLIEVINEDNEEKKEEYLRLVKKSNKESQEELNTLMSKNFLEVTYICLKTYISV